MNSITYKACKVKLHPTSSAWGPDTRFGKNKCNNYVHTYSTFRNSLLERFFHLWNRLTLAACYQLVQSIWKKGFALAKNGRIGGGRWVSAQGAVHMVAALAGCRMALVSTGWTISHFVSTKIEALFSPCRGTLSGTVGSLQSGGALTTPTHC